ncbi:trypsin-like protease, partial [Ramicandelaber brevisporus]
MAHLIVTQQTPDGELIDFCGGAIITDSIVITAAHCVYSLSAQSVVPPTAVQIHVGTITNRSSSPTKASEVRVHPGYEPGPLRNDIAVIRLATRLSFSTPDVQPIKLTSTHFGEGVALTAIGWGLTKWSNLDSDSPVLLKTSLVTAPDSQCKSTNTMFASQDGPVVCTGNTPDHDTCAGDSGGPLVL